jgi:hypothetical protein
MRCQHPDILVHYLLATVGGDVQSYLVESDASVVAARAAIHELIERLGDRSAA